MTAGGEDGEHKKLLQPVKDVLNSLFARGYRNLKKHSTTEFTIPSVFAEMQGGQTSRNEVTPESDVWAVRIGRAYLFFIDASILMLYFSIFD